MFDCILVVFSYLIFTPTYYILYFSRFKLSKYQKRRNRIIRGFSSLVITCKNLGVYISRLLLNRHQKREIEL